MAMNNNPEQKQNSQFPPSKPSGRQKTKEQIASEERVVGGCATAGAVIFVLLNLTTGIVPGGFIGGFVGSAIGAVVGMGINALRRHPVQERQPTTGLVVGGAANNAAVRLTWLPIERKDIENQSVVGRQYLNQSLNKAIADLARLWIIEGKPSMAELTISGYDNDPRELYEIPEVCLWARQMANEIPVLPFFLTDTSLDRFAGWLCGPVSKAALTAPEFGEKFTEARMRCVTKASAESSDFLMRMGADQATISKFYFQIMADHASQREQAQNFEGGGYTVQAREEGKAQQFQKKNTTSRGSSDVKIILSILAFGCIAIALYWAWIKLPAISGITGSLLQIGSPASSSTPLPTKPAAAAPAQPNQAGGLCWTHELKDFTGNRSQAWDKFLDDETRRLISYNQFIEDVVVKNPQLKKDGYVFYSQKTFVLPEVCH